MQKIWQWFSIRRGFLAGFALASILFGGVASAEMIGQQIMAYFPNYTMKFDGVAKAPPSDQQPILVNGRTYVPLRFVAEAMGHPVEFEAATQTIYVGARPEKKRPSVLLHPDKADNTTWWTDVTNSYKRDWVKKLNYGNYRDVNGVDRENAWVFEAGTCYNFSTCLSSQSSSTGSVEKEFVLNGKYSKLSGTIFPTEWYKGNASGRNVGRVIVKDEYDKVIYESGWVRATGVNDAVPFSVDVRGVGKVKIQMHVSMADGLIGSNDYLTAMLGIENLGVE